MEIPEFVGVFKDDEFIELILRRSVLERHSLKNHVKKNNSTVEYVNECAGVT